MNIFKKILHIGGHRWKTTHTNRWMLPTKQECRFCEDVRWVDTKHPLAGELEYVWVYSDGSVEGPYPFGEGW